MRVVNIFEKYHFWLNFVKKISKAVEERGIIQIWQLVKI